MNVISNLSASKQTRGDSAPGKTAGPHASFQAAKRDLKKDGKPILAARNVFKSYHKGKLEVPVLRGVDFSIRPGEFTAVIGQSGLPAERFYRQFFSVTTYTIFLGVGPPAG